MLNNNSIRIKELSRGLSGCSIEISKQGNLLKKSPLKIYNNRLKKQLIKQKDFKKLSFENVLVPKIYNYWFDQELLTIEMEYIQAESEINFFYHASVSQIENVFETINNYLIQISKNSFDYDFTENIYNKLMSLKINSKYGDLINQLLGLLEKKNIIIPNSVCHGDLTLSNMLFQDKKIYFIDFLDSYINSYICDLVKLKQDLYYLWNLEILSLDNLRHKIIYKKFWKYIYTNNIEYLRSPEFKILDIINYLRIEPYINSAVHRNLVDCIIYKISLEINA